MATIVNNPPPERVVQVERSDSSGWAVAVIILLAIIALGIFAYFHYYRTGATAPSGGTNINVTLPGGTSNTGTPPSSGY